jgi:tetratricopeptide (TPR) repeat protein
MPAEQIDAHVDGTAVSNSDWAAAAARYEAVVESRPGQVDAKFALARAYVELGRLQDAIDVLNHPSLAGLEKTKRRLAAAYVRAKNYPLAVPLLRDLIAQFPDNRKFRRWLDLCQGSKPDHQAIADAVQETQELISEKRLAEAEQLCSVLIAQHPNVARPHFDLGRIYTLQKRWAEAVPPLREAMAMEPGNTKVRKSLARALLKIGEAEQALALLNSPSDKEMDFDAMFLAHQCHVKLKNWAGVQSIGARLLELLAQEDPRRDKILAMQHDADAQYHYNRHEWLAALGHARKALALAPGESSIRLLMGRTLMRLSRLAEALDEFNTLLADGNYQTVALQLKADTLVLLARVDDAIALYREALLKEPDHPLLNQRLAYALLLKGDIGGFHAFHEKRRGTKTFAETNKVYPFKDWNGDLAIEGKLLVWSEVGLGVGQNILHMTFLKSLVALGMDVVLEVERRMVDLCRRSFPDIKVVPSDGELPPGISHHTPIASLSRWFKPDLASFEDMRPFFLPDPQQVVAHRARIQEAAGDGQILIGISWTSTNPFVGDVKSIAPEELLKAVSVPGVTLVNLQYGDHSQAIAAAEASTGTRLMDSGIDNSNDLDGLAAVIAAMDLVVCIGHTTAHMAGAVGTPNFVLLPAAPFAHWLEQGEHCIWYPAATLFRQAPIDDNWSAVLGQVRYAVVEFASRYNEEAWLTKTLLPTHPSSARAEPMSERGIRDCVRAFFDQGAYRSALALLDRLGFDDQPQDLRILKADMLALIGRWEDARLLYSSLRTSVDDPAVIDRKLLENSLASFELEEALAIARRLADAGASHRLIAANVLYRLRRHDEALAELRLLSMRAPQMEGLSTVTANVLLEQGAVDRAASYLSAQAAVTNSAEDYTLLGRALSTQGLHEQALAAFDKAISVSKYNPAANFWRTQERIKHGAVVLAPLPPLQGERPHVSPEDVVIFLVVDKVYFWKHALVLMGSIARRSPGAKCHVHVVNPDRKVAEAIEAIRQLLPKFGISFTYEHPDFTRCTDIHIRTYFASVRFVRLAQLIAEAPANYLCVDADCIVRGEIANRLPDGDIGDVAIRLRYDERPHLTVAAGALVLRPTPAARQFIDQVAKPIERTLEAGEAVWFLDQIVLSHAVRELQDRNGHVSQLDMTYIDWFFDENSLIWTGKGKRKLESDRYTLEALGYRYLNDELRKLGFVCLPDL